MKTSYIKNDGKWPRFFYEKTVLFIRKQKNAENNITKH